MVAYMASSQAKYLLVYSPTSWPALADVVVQLLNRTEITAAGDASTSNDTPTPENLSAEWVVRGIRGSDALWRFDTA